MKSLQMPLFLPLIQFSMQNQIVQWKKFVPIVPDINNSKYIIIPKCTWVCRSTNSMQYSIVLRLYYRDVRVL